MPGGRAPWDTVQTPAKPESLVSCKVAEYGEALFFTPSGSVVVVITGGGEVAMCSGNEALATLPDAVSVNVTATVKSPSTTGVPEMCPVFWSRLTPLGRCSADQVPAAPVFA